MITPGALTPVFQGWLMMNLERSAGVKAKCRGQVLRFAPALPCPAVVVVSICPASMVAALPWNQWQLSREMGGRLRLESLATLVWNTQPSIPSILRSACP